MPIGKDSIQKRVAKTAPETTAEVAETAVKPAPAKKAPAKKPAATTAAKKAASATTAEKKPAAKKAPAKKPAVPKAEMPAEPVAPATAVMANVSPEVVEAVVGHEEGAAVEHVSIGDKMPTYLL